MTERSVMPPAAWLLVAAGAFLAVAFDARPVIAFSVAAFFWAAWANR